ncbi:MAG: hypothetical protein V1755_09115 [Chloroflexota bacterium]
MENAQAGTDPRQLMLFVQSIKGAPASVLLALGFTGRYMSHQELQVWTRCGHTQITVALRSLAALGWLSMRSTRGPWALAPERQLPVRLLPGGGSALKAPGSSGDSINYPDRETTLLSAQKKQLLEALLQRGIREPTASELAELPHMTLEYLQAHVEAARAHGLRVGAAIEAMRLAAPPPTKPTPRDRQAEVEEKIRRFMQGG